MQVYAIDENRLLLAANADKGKNYQCPECHGAVRLRRGRQRQPHFFHPKVNPKCRLSQKGIIHLQLQNFIKNLFKEAEMEKQFPQIGRIADVADMGGKRVFEIQYSLMSLEEAKGRCQDYEGLGYQVIWILHDRTFNQKRTSATERFLRTKTCYFSDMDSRGLGMIYDQLEEIKGRQRHSKSSPFRVRLEALKTLPAFKWPDELVLRSQTWPLYCEGDLFDLSLRGKFSSDSNLRRLKLLARLKEIYLTGLHMLLAKSSR